MESSITNKPTTRVDSPGGEVWQENHGQKLSVPKWIGENPNWALGVAVTFGVLVGWFVKRK